MKARCDRCMGKERLRTTYWDTTLCAQCVAVAVKEMDATNSWPIYPYAYVP